MPFRFVISSSNGQRFEAPFNPESVRRRKATRWKANEEAKVDFPSSQWEGGDPADLSLRLLFDSPNAAIYGRDTTPVRNFLAALRELAEAGDSDQPPILEVNWAGEEVLTCVLSSVEEEIVQVSSDGTILRAYADLQFMQYRPPGSMSSGTTTPPGGV